ncbi:vacuolar sorting-associated protein [Sporothrix schenckii 1099-18]|uniref:Vacuolar sorting-associated protein n=1 Tax=Sporothrix schenckii 1099-18 TaxID=1397361 RepID=A0A0F2M5T6_SPOSC|nr:vacuolar sorting-associated protein [Sporothrix schenckii 1099-18]KJR85063.1 vacuolar sorting-associated protein [Sporothrix schenckii 1099-18]
MYHVRRLTITAISIGLVIFIFTYLPTVLNPTPPSAEEKRRDKKWIDSSPYWLDRQACRWFSLCGVHHLRWDAPALGNHTNERHDNDDDGHELGLDLKSLELRELFAVSDSYKWLSRESTGDESWEIAGRAKTIAVATSTSESPDTPDEPAEPEPSTDREGPAMGELRKRAASPPSTPFNDPYAIPQYVLDHAPLVHLFSGENFWPSHIAEHVKHMIPATNGSAIRDRKTGDIIRPNGSHPLTLDNLYETLNHYRTRVTLTSEVDVESRPEWLHSHYGIPLPFDGDNNDGSDGSNPHTNPDIRNGHDYEQPDHKFSDDTTWFAVDKDHPLNRISDPRKLPTPQEVMAMRQAKGPREALTRFNGPQEARVRQLLHERAAAAVAASTGAPRHQIVVGDAPQSVMGGDGYDDTVDTPQDPPVRGYKPDTSGYSEAPAILVMVDKGSGILDAFWFFFYSYNLGQTVLKVRYGNHVGDWEHCMVRFENGVPRALYLSEHAGGQAYAWSALEKYNNASSTTGIQRPVIYSAVGSHAMYALPGTHPYVLPFKMLRDETDKGPLWDPALNNLAYHYDYVLDREQGDAGSHDPENEEDDDDDVVDEDGRASASSSASKSSLKKKKDKTPGGPWVPPTSLTPASTNPDAPTSWFHFRGLWGDALYELGDPRQWRLFGQYHYTEGPAGPKFKNLGREKVCQAERCRILYSLDAGKKASWYS